MAEYCDSFVFSENNQDHYEMVPNETDNYQFWQGLRGPYFIPSVDEEGVLSWTNNGQLPNPDPVRIVGKDGRGITLTGQCETVAELPEDPEQGEAWAVGEEEPFECYAWFGEWVDMGLMFPKGDPGQDGHDGQDGVSPEITVTDITGGHRVTITDKDHPAGQTFDVMNGQNGQDGQDGVSPGITITDITGGHTVTITDKDHPTGQSFNVMNGQDGAAGPGVPAGGSAGQFYRKASATDYDGEWHTLSAGDSSFDSSLTYSSGTVGKELGDQKNTLTQFGTEVDTVENGLAIPQTGNTASRSIPIGAFIYLTGNSDQTNLPDGFYQNTSGSVIGSGATFTLSNLTRCYQDTGALNTLNDKLITKIGSVVNETGFSFYGNIRKVGNVVVASISFGVTSLAANTEVKLGTINEGFRPSVISDGQAINVDVTVRNQVPVYISIRTTGEIYVITNSTVRDGYIVGNLTYCT